VNPTHSAAVIPCSFTAAKNQTPAIPATTASVFSPRPSHPSAASAIGGTRTAAKKTPPKNSPSESPAARTHARPAVIPSASGTSANTHAARHHGRAIIFEEDAEGERVIWSFSGCAEGTRFFGRGNACLRHSR